MTKRLLVWAALTAAVLMIPLIANFPWTSGDYVFASVLIFGAGFLFEIARKKASRNDAYKYGARLALLASFLLIWINGAVGIIGDSDANLFYAAVILTLFLGTIISRLKAKGMAYTLFTAAAVQFVIPIIAYIINEPDFSPGVVAVFMLNGFWVMMFAGSGLLFKNAENQPLQNA